VTATSLIGILVPLLFALLALPLVARFAVGKVIFRRVRKERLLPLEAGLGADSGDRAALEAFTAFLKAKTGTAFPARLAIREDIDALILLFQDAFSREGKKATKFSFPVSDLIKCAFLLMEELDASLRGSGSFRRLASTRISTVRRAARVGEIYDALYERLPFLKALRSGRLTGKLIRILLIPLVGLPSVTISVAASLVSLVATEAPWRYYYATLLARLFRYGLMLYGDKKGQIRESLKRFDRDRVRRDASGVEWIIDPENAPERSPLYERAFLLYQRTLEEMGLGPEKDVAFDGVVYRFNGARRLFKKLLRLPVRAAGKFNPLSDSNTDDLGRLARLVGAIASPYGGREPFYDGLRLVDLFDSLYMLSLLGYARILNGEFLLENVSVDFVLAAKNFNDEVFGELLPKRLPFFSRYYRSMRLYGKIRLLVKAVRAGNPLTFIWSMTGPIAAEGIKAAVRDYAYRRAGRMALYCFESNYLKRKRLF